MKYFIKYAFQNEYYLLFLRYTYLRMKIKIQNYSKDKLKAYFDDFFYVLNSSDFN